MAMITRAISLEKERFELMFLGDAPQLGQQVRLPLSEQYASE
jgi:hypothetical protein